MPNGRRLLIINRWRDPQFTAFHEYLDHARHRVSYITTRASRHVLRTSSAAAIHELETLDRPDEVVRCARAAAAENDGGFDAVIALAEADLEAAAQVRHELGIRGDLPDQARRYRDKIEMKRTVQQAGIAVPRFTPCTSEVDVISFARLTGFPVILKPRRGAASRGVHKAHSETECRQLLRRVDLADYECEDYIDGEVLIADGLVYAGSIAVFLPSRYLGTCYEFSLGQPSGTVHIDDPALAEHVRGFTQEVLDALGHTRGAFHLELFLKRSGELVFLEIGARVGGGEVCHLFRDVLQVDLPRECVRMEAGDWSPPELPHQPNVGGAVLFPAPTAVPCQVVRRASLREHLRWLYAEILPYEGGVIDALGGYGTTSISGMFLFQGPSSAEVVQDIMRARQLFEIETMPLSPPDSPVQRTSWCAHE